jgi:exodeoxyribonuclease V alpha subunit
MSTTLFERAQAFVDARLLTQGDLHLVARAAARFSEADAETLLAMAFALRAPRQGSVGVDLCQLEAQVTADAERGRAEPEAEAAEPPTPVALPWPRDAAAWQSRVLGSSMVAPAESVAPKDAQRPFVAQPVEGGILLVTRRLFEQQRSIAAQLQTRLAAQPEPPPPADLEVGILALIADEPSEKLADEKAKAKRLVAAQETRAAVRLAATRSLSIITGGPGTGKTFSLSRLLALLIQAEDPSRPLLIELAAPTGKAAVRMNEAILEGVGSITQDAFKSVGPRLQGLKAKTLHKLVGLRPDGTVRHNRANPITADIVVVDEVSMVDLALMRALLDAVPAAARLILLGDRDQLASVEAGCVLADLVRDPLSSSRNVGALLTPSVQRFTQSRRFASAPNIASIAASLQGDADAVGVAAAVAVFTGRAHHEDEFAKAEGAQRVTWIQAPPASDARSSDPKADQAAFAARMGRLLAPFMEHVGLVQPPTGAALNDEAYAACLLRLAAEGRPDDPWARLRESEAQRALLDTFDRYRVLAVHRRGRLGVEGLNAAFTRDFQAHLRDKGLRLGARDGHWLGRPVLITENAYDVDLRNGDVGLVLPEPTHSAQAPLALVAVFPAEGGRVKHVPLKRLPPHETAFTMTVHKSQGSQFAHTALVLSDRDSPIQTRELVYTGVTRASNRLTWMGDEGVLERALERRIARASGLAELLRAD